MSDLTNPLYALDPSSRIRTNIYQDETLDIISTRIMNILKEDMFLIYMKQLAWDHFVSTNANGIINNNITNVELKSKIKKYLDEYGNKELIIATVMKTYEHIHTSHTYIHPLIKQRACSRTSMDELNDVVREVRCVWEKGINEELLAIGTELKRKFCICRYVYVYVCISICICITV